ncbi:hypothetical protein BLX87_23550 [Bacillus sp. VT-16-64]|nr:hypothetical protein BLX87_23550 [Bacillus sp. VT-16-64]
MAEKSSQVLYVLIQEAGTKSGHGKSGRWPKLTLLLKELVIICQDASSIPTEKGRFCAGF